jgi:hypothetical protein
MTVPPPGFPVARQQRLPSVHAQSGASATIAPTLDATATTRPRSRRATRSSSVRPAPSSISVSGSTGDPNVNVTRRNLGMCLPRGSASKVPPIQAGTEGARARRSSWPIPRRNRCSRPSGERQPSGNHTCAYPASSTRAAERTAAPEGGVVHRHQHTACGQNRQGRGNPLWAVRRPQHNGGRRRYPCKPETAGKCRGVIRQRPTIQHRGACLRRDKHRRVPAALCKAAQQAANGPGLSHRPALSSRPAWSAVPRPTSAAGTARHRSCPYTWSWPDSLFERHHKRGDGRQHDQGRRASRQE